VWAAVRRQCFAHLTCNVGIEPHVVQRIALLSLQHPAARAIKARIDRVRVCVCMCGCDDPAHARDVPMPGPSLDGEISRSVDRVEGFLADWLKGPQIGLDGIVFGPCSTLLSFDCLSLMSRADCCGMPMRLVERVCVRCRIAPTLFDCSPSLHVHVRVARKAVGSRRSGAAQGWRDAANLRLSTFD
jgi:hypothetical protein